MLSLPLLFGFIAASLVVLVIPGPGVLFVVTRSVAQGYRAGMASVLGLAAGAFIHVIFATVGLSAILMASATAFTLVKLIGAGYLIYLGLRTLLSRSQLVDGEAPTPLPLKRLAMDGVVISLFNPKIAVFFLAFLPQFVDPSLGHVPGQFFVLGCIYCALAILSDGTYCLLAGSLRHALTGFVNRSALPRLISGWIYIGLGISTALTGRRA